MQTTAELNENFAIPNVLRFDEDRNGLVRAQVSTPTADATIYLLGAHLTFWQPFNCEPMLYSGCDERFLKEHSTHVGVPVLFPWFGAKTLSAHSRETTPDDANAPMHGFARQQTWTLQFAASTGDDLHLTFTLAPNDLSRSFGYGPFRLALSITVGTNLNFEMSVANDDTQPLYFEEALHTYLAVKDVREASVEGLCQTEYLDKVDNFARKRQEEKFLCFHGRTDRTYVNTEARTVLHDPLAKRLMSVEKTGSRSTVVWNPWDELAKTYNDIGADGWPRFVCIETVNAGENAVTLARGETHTMRLTLRPSKIGY